MLSGVVVDTSYLICLADTSRPNCQHARRYWQHFREQKIAVYLSTIVVSEFCIKQSVNDLNHLKPFVTLPFNWNHAVKSAELNFSTVKRKNKMRDALKDDYKIIAQAMVVQAGWIISEDEDLCGNVKQMQASRSAHLRAINLNDGFDLSHFNAAGQRHLNFENQDSADTSDP